MTSEPNRQPHPRRLASAVRRRRQQLSLTIKQLAFAASISIRSVHYIEAADATFRPRGTTLEGLDSALRWAPGSALRVYERGGRPRISQGPPPAQPEPPARTRHTRPAPPEPTEARVVKRAGLPRAVELSLLEHLAARRQDMEAALEAEAGMLLATLIPMLAPRSQGRRP